MNDHHAVFFPKIITFILCYSLLSYSVNANEQLIITVINQQSDGIENVVVSAYPQDQQQAFKVIPKSQRIVDQVDKKFIRYVTAIQKGSQVSFPNHDQIRHHVYSFSNAKSFEIPLYKGSPKTPVVFDKTGVVSLGCNIHDWMSAYIYVVDTPYFSITNQQGEAALELPPGKYKLHYWHPELDEENSQMTSLLDISAEPSHNAPFQLSLKKSWQFRRGPLASSSLGNYR